MLIYKDVITNDEIISDSWNLQEVDGIVYEVNCSMVTEGVGSYDIGANPSAEEAGEDLDDQSAKVNDIVHNFRLQSMQFDKKSYLSCLKTYMKAVKAYLTENNEPKENIDKFESGAGAFAKKILANFNDWEFFTGESGNPDGMIILMNYREDNVTPYIVVWKHGLKGMKV